MENTEQKGTALQEAVESKISQMIEEFLDVQLVVLKQLKQRQSIEADEIFALNDSIRTLHHVKKILGMTKVVPVSIMD
ncbi:hypothetical protein [Brevibacillus laterosporus]|uniref:hypothetical protein n=1 Tax=Brevibacillus laterosporus TaxID=1465 RepID=UPI003D19D8E5